MRPIYLEVQGLEVYCALNCRQVGNITEIFSFQKFEDNPSGYGA